MPTAGLDWLRAALIVGAGGAAGSMLRYGVGALLARTTLPIGTFSVNLLGSFLIAFLLFLSPSRVALSPEMRLLLATGLLGGFTTMSTFAYETLVLAEGAHWTRATFYVLATVMGSIGMALVGRVLAHALG